MARWRVSLSALPIIRLPLEASAHTRPRHADGDHPLAAFADHSPAAQVPKRPIRAGINPKYVPAANSGELGLAGRFVSTSVGLGLPFDSKSQACVNSPRYTGSVPLDCDKSLMEAPRHV